LPPNCHDTQQNLRDLAGYYAHISALDAELGRILGYLREEGLSDDTLVVYTSDHGSMLGSQGHTHKQRPWAESAMVPMIMAQPDSIPEGQENGTLFSLLDLASTLLGALGMPIPEAMQGADLSRCATEGVTVDNRILYLADLITTDQADHYGVKPWRGVKSERYTYACDVRGEWLLYDDEADPYQLNNLISDPAYAVVRADLRAAMNVDMARFGDTLLDVPEALEAWGLTDTYRIRTEHLYTGTNMGGRLPR
jgi:arylsulfatase A-like enzyme